MEMATSMVLCAYSPLSGGLCKHFGNGCFIALSIVSTLTSPLWFSPVLTSYSWPDVDRVDFFSPLKSYLVISPELNIHQNGEFALHKSEHK